MNARDEFSETALMKAAWRNYPHIVQILINKGADVNAKANMGVTALMFAAFNGHTTTVQALLDKGADVNAKDIISGVWVLLFFFVL